MIAQDSKSTGHVVLSVSVTGEYSYSRWGAACTAMRLVGWKSRSYTSLRISIGITKKREDSSAMLAGEVSGWLVVKQDRGTCKDVKYSHSHLPRLRLQSIYLDTCRFEGELDSRRTSIRDRQRPQILSEVYVQSTWNGTRVSPGGNVIDMCMRGVARSQQQVQVAKHE